MAAHLQRGISWNKLCTPEQVVKDKLKDDIDHKKQ